MACDYETCRSNLEKLVVWYATRASERNEATTRLQLIDEIFFNCLGRDKEDSILESVSDSISKPGQGLEKAIQ